VESPPEHGRRAAPCEDVLLDSQQKRKPDLAQLVGGEQQRSLRE